MLPASKTYLKSLLTGSISTYAVIIEGSSAREITLLLEVIVNFCNGVIPANNREVLQLIKHKNVLRSLCVRIEQVARRKRLLKENCVAVRKLLRISLQYM